MKQETLNGVMFLGAHPDDETVMAGGTLALLSAHGVPTYVVCATDGRGGESGDVPGIKSPADLATVRIAELHSAAQALGVRRVMLLGYEDPVIGPGDQLYNFTTDEEHLVTQIADMIWVRGANVVLTHGSDGEYGHPAHIQMHRAVLRAVREHLPHVSVYGVAAHLPGIEDRLWNQSDPADVALDITPWSTEKHNAMLAHRSQHLLFKRRRKLESVQQAMRTIESFHCHWSGSRTSKRPDAFTSLLLKAGAWLPQHGHDELAMHA